MSDDKMQTESTNPVAADAAAPSKNEVPGKPKTIDSLRHIASVLETAVKMRETRLTAGRVLRLTSALRKELTGDVISAFIKTSLAPEVESRPFLLYCALKAGENEASAMETESEASEQNEVPAKPSTTPEVEMYCFMILLMYTMDKKRIQQAQEIALKALDRLALLNRRTLDGIAARIYFYYSLSHEQLGQLAHVRSPLLALHRTATLRHDVIGQETLLNLLLRNYLHFNLYDQAEKFRSKAQKEEVFQSHQQSCRYLYYLGRIRAIQLEYSEARDCLQQASRKAPSSALGFRVTVDKWLTLVRLLLGEVPERAEFAVPGLTRALHPYFEITQAVRRGDLDMFAQVAQRHAHVFKADSTHNLVTRLHHNVLRTGLRRISLAYSRISLSEVAAKLRLPSVEDTECIVAKAIRDGGVEAALDHEASAMISRDAQDVYVSAEPADAFHARVAFCLDLHNEAVKAMRYEPNAHKKKLEHATARMERLSAEAELAKALEEEDDDMDGF